MRRVVGYLSMQAQTRLPDPTALVWQEGETFTLERADTDPVKLGEKWTDAHQALNALITSHRATAGRAGK